jgi:oxygen-dependent protoporphyrinogen oxidase
VADVVGARLGSEVLERLVEPLVGGINAGTAEHLSLRSAARPLSDAAKSHRSLVLGLRRQRASAAPAGPTTAPVFLGVVGGMERIVERLRSSLDDVDVRLGTAVRSIAPEGDGWRVACEPGPDVDTDAVVLTVPAFAAAPILAEVAPDAARELEEIRYASVAVTTLGYRPAALDRPLDGSGVLVPRSEGHLMTACTWSTTKWPALKESGLVLLRASAGRHGDERALDLDDDTLVARLHDELRTVVDVTEAPEVSRVDRWPRSFPQYEPGHESRVNRIEAALVGTPGLAVAGAAYRGLGIAACVQQAEIAAGRVMNQLAHHPAGSRDT